jgi:hypothetical protein
MLPHDEPAIGNADSIIRRVNPGQHVVFDENIGQNRISSKLFKPSSGENGGMSVDILALMVADGVDPRRFVTSSTFLGSLVFQAGVARGVGLWIGYDPITGDPLIEDNPYHGEVWGHPRPNRFTAAQQTALRKASTWFVELDGVVIDP